MGRRTAGLATAIAALALGAPGSVWAQDGARAAGMEPITLGHRTRVPSAVLGEDRPVLVYTPDGYDDSAGAYPVLYLLDGDDHFHHATGVTQFLSRVNRMPGMIVVGVGNVPGERGRRYNMTPPLTTDPSASDVGGATDFLRFLRDELQPWVDSRYRTIPYSVLVGHSLGGLFATHVLVEDPGAFQGYVSISPSLWWDEARFVERATAIFEGRADVRASLYMTMGNEGGAMLAGAWTLASILETQAPEAFRWKWTHLPGETHGSVPHRSLYDGLEWLFDGWVPRDMGRLAGLEGDEGLRAIFAHYRDLADRVGAEVPVPEDAVDALAQRLARQGRHADALRALEWNAARFPSSGRALNHVADAQRVLCRWEEARDNYAAAYELALAGAYPNVDGYRMDLERVTRDLERGADCAAPGPAGRGG